MTDFALDMYHMHKNFTVHNWVEKNKDDKELMRKFLQFRLNCCLEELLETASASGLELNIKGGKYTFEGNFENLDPEEIVDGLIDLTVFAVGTLDLFSVDGNHAWDEVYRANMDKTPGIKEGRPNPLGLPDLIKNPGWKAPSHEGNHGHFPRLK